MERMLLLAILVVAVTTAAYFFQAQDREFTCTPTESMPESAFPPDMPGNVNGWSESYLANEAIVLPWRGVMKLDPGLENFIDDGWRGTKWPWQRILEGELSIEVFRIDTDQPVYARASPSTLGYGNLGIIPTLWSFPSSGCYKFIAKHDTGAHIYELEAILRVDFVD